MGPGSPRCLFRRGPPSFIHNFQKSRIRGFMAADTGTFDSAFSVHVDGKRLVVGSQIYSTQSQQQRESRPRALPSVIGTDPFPQATNDADRPDLKAFSYPLVPSDSKPAIGEAVWSYSGRS